MLFVLLAAFLAIVIIFRNEIKKMIIYSILAILIFSLWHVAWWGALLVIALFVIPFFGGMIYEYLKGRQGMKKI